MKLILQSTLRSLGITEKYAGFSLAVTDATGPMWSETSVP